MTTSKDMLGTIPRIRNVRKTPKYLQTFADYLYSKHHKSANTVSNTVSRLTTVHNHLMNSRSFKSRFNGDWRTVINCPIAFAEITDFDLFFDNRYQSKSANTRLAYKSAVKRFMSYAVTRLGYTNPMSDAHWAEVSVSRKNAADRTKEVPIVTEQIINQVYQAVSTLPASPLNVQRSIALQTLIETGGRVNEVLPLETKDVHKTDRGHVVRLANHKTIEKRYKERLVPVSEQLFDALQNHFELNKQDRGFIKYAFINNLGNPLSYSGFLKYIRKLGQIVGIRGLSPHLFRHYRITQWVKEHGINGSEQVAYWSGDLWPTLLRVYCHYEPK